MMMMAMISPPHPLPSGIQRVVMTLVAEEVFAEGRNPFVSSHCGLPPSPPNNPAQQRGHSEL